MKLDDRDVEEITGILTNGHVSKDALEQFWQRIHKRAQYEPRERNDAVRFELFWVGYSTGKREGLTLADETLKAALLPLRERIRLAVESAPEDVPAKFVDYAVSFSQAALEGVDKCLAALGIPIPE